MNALPAELTTMLLATLDDPTRTHERALLERYGRTCAILALDFSGMTQRSASDGIVYALALCAAALEAITPAIVAHGGELVTMEADTIFALFDAPEPALLAALDAQRSLQAFNRTRTGHIGDGTRNDPIRAAIGLGHGEVVHVPGHDVFGAEVNHAFVLGEDVATPGEVLASAAFLARLGVPPAGIGSFRAPEEREQQAGIAFHILSDYR